MLGHQNMVTFRDINRPTTPAQPVPASPFPLPPLVLAKLRSLKAQYDAVLDTALLMEGYEQGAALDIRTGIVYPPGSLPRQEN